MVAPLSSHLITDKLRLRRRGEDVLQPLSHSFAPGKITAVIGERGSGKSALIRLLAGLERASGGRVEVDGIDVTRTPPRRRAFGVARAEDRLFPQMSLARNLTLPLRLRGVDRKRQGEGLEAMLELAGLSQEAGLRPGAVGEGAVRRAVLARAFMGEPRVALLDEPFGGPEEAAECLGLLRRLQSVLGTTVVLATRQGRLALALAERVLVLRGGRVDQEDRPETVFARPRDAYAAGLFGEVNRLGGTVESLEEDSVFVRLACGPVVEAVRGGPGLQEKRPCIVLLRPEAVAVAAASAAEMGEGAIDARVVEAQFFGDTILLRLLIGSGEAVVARRPALGGMRGLSPGRGAAIAWQPHQAFAYRL